MKSVLSFGGRNGPTVRAASTNASQAVADLIAAGGNIMGVLITCETNAIRFALGSTVPTQDPAGTGHILLSAQSIKVMGSHAVRSLRFISQAAGAHAVLQITPEYEV